MADAAWLVLREQGALIEESGDDDGEELKFDEKDELAEKVGLHLEDINVSPHPDAEVNELQLEKESEGNFSVGDAVDSSTLR